MLLADSLNLEGRLGLAVLASAWKGFHGSLLHRPSSVCPGCFSLRRLEAGHNPGAGPLYSHYGGFSL